MWFEAPASSSAPHFDGHHFPVESFGGAAGCAWAEAIGARPNFPCAAPATTPAAPAIPAVFKKLRRSGGSGASSGERSTISVMALPPGGIYAGAGVSDRRLRMSTSTSNPGGGSLIMGSLFDRDRYAERLP